MPAAVVHTAGNTEDHLIVHTEDKLIVPHNLQLLLLFKAHINVERTQGGGMVPYVFKYIFKPPKPSDVDLRTQEVPVQQDVGQPPVQNAPRDEIREYREARRIGATEAAWLIFEFRSLNFNPSVVSLAIHLQGERVFIVRNSTLPEDHEASSQLERYLSRPMDYQDMTYITYYEETNIYSVLPVTHHQYQMDTGIPPRYVVNRGPENKRVARILWTPPSSTELFSLRRILLHEPVSSFAQARTLNGTMYETYREAGVAKGLFVEGGEFRLSLQEAVATYATPQELRIMLITCYQAGANPTALLNEFQNSMSADIQGHTTEDVQQELLSRLHKISDHHGGRLLRLFQTFPPPPAVLLGT
jgi:hypothetical protein